MTDAQGVTGPLYRITDNTAHTVSIQSAGARACLSFHADGRVTFRSEIPPDEAAREFIEIFIRQGWLRYAPDSEWKQRAEDAERELAALKADPPYSGVTG